MPNSRIQHLLCVPQPCLIANLLFAKTKAGNEKFGCIGMKRMYTLSQIIRRKNTIIFPNKRKKVKENAQSGTKSLNFGQIICFKTYLVGKT